MIHSLRGILAAVEPNFIVIECSGVGFGVRTTMNTIGKLPKTGSEVKIYTHLSVREDAMELFGFSEPSELNCFRMLTAVTGVGPKAAISILSELTPDKLMLCVASGDHKSITRAQGVGPKLASRIVLELKDKISNEELAGGMEGAAFAAAADPKTNAGEAMSALVVLGYAQSEAAAAVARFAPDTPVQEMIKGALKILSGGR
ncbi:MULTISPECIES: Holliday junction branch migration protein RuvA [Oscillospiraceae]|uniref:Holliday junction branch migration complex subunit RuvA n=1 Tax=Harryflintia acetispora TaxID=1849041 RepID=A0A9X8UH52_9FIRM|nr:MULTISPECIES: Holliday junction branch migration protein RuvA [Oscillospiraceae]RGB66550.1 Holliday junction branch migration protein RuvA [Harryflintia acetispora]TCL41070.1 Holliday junction DNA helicase subunit RuvA [Harryflintia acetispora]